METRVHVSLEVQDLNESITFYSRLFQREPTKIREDYANFRMETPQLHLALVHNPTRGAEPPSNRHYGIELFADENLRAWLEKARSSGIDARVEDQTTCCYAVADKFWARDPDGHEWEFWVRHAEADEMHAPKPGALGTDEAACCAPSDAGSKVTDEKTCCAPGRC